MLKNYLKIAARNIAKDRGYSFINIFGLAIGMACTIMILLYVLNEHSYDKHHKNADQIYRIATNAMIGDTKIDQIYTPAILTPTMLENFPEVEYSIRFQNNSKGLPVTYGDNTFTEKQITMVDPEIFNVFTIPFIVGDSLTALTEPNSVVISESIAKKYFSNENPLGEMLLVKDMNCKVTGIVKDLPENSHFHFNIFISIKKTDWYKSDEWFNNNWKTYLKLKKNTSVAGFNLKLANLVDDYIFNGAEEYNKWAAKGNYWEYYLQPMLDIHLNSDLNGEFEQNGNALYVSIFTIIAVLIIVIASFNYVNLSTARLSNRSREVGIRKVVGSTRSSLIKQFLTESVLTCLIALIITLTIVSILMPIFSELVGVYSIKVSFFDNYTYLIGMVVFAIIVGIISGAYPAFYLSSIDSLSALSNKRNVSGKWFRNGLVLIQFAISVILFIGTLVIRDQLDYSQNKKLGFDKEQVLVIKGTQVLKEKNEVFKHSLLKNLKISSVTGAAYLPGMGFSNIGFGAEGKDHGLALNLLIGDYGFQETLKLEMVQGRFYSRDFPSDTNGVVINESTARLLGWDEPLKMHLKANNKKYNVIGVVKDFHYESLHQVIKPGAIMFRAGDFKWEEIYIAAKVNTKELDKTINYIQKKWEEYALDMPFEYSFLSEEYDGLYKNEQRTSNITATFSFLAIFIACLGLFGLVAFAAEQRTKEIGIRKVLGASVFEILLMLTKDFTFWILVANIIAWPISYFILNNWLQNFAYRIEIGWEVFVLSGTVVSIISLLTVSFQTIKAALLNPVNSLKNE